MVKKKMSAREVFRRFKDSVAETVASDCIEIHSDSLALISGCRTITEYSKEFLKLKLGNLTVIIEGEELEPESLINGQMAVSGIIKGVKYIADR